MIRPKCGKFLPGIMDGEEKPPPLYTGQGNYAIIEKNGQEDAMLYYIVEERYRDYQWCRNSLKSLLDEVKKRRLSIEEVPRIEDISPEDVSPVVFVLGATSEWTENTIHNASLHHVCPISMSTRGLSAIGDTFSAVSMDINGCINLGVNYLRSLGRERIALYGVNRDSTSDPYKALVFSRIFGSDDNVFYIDTDYAAMFEKLRSRLPEYDSIICCNDYAAVSLVTKLKSIGVNPTKDVYVVAIGDAYISRLCQPSLTTVSDDYEHFGTAAMSIYGIMRRQEFISSMDIRLKTILHVRETTGNEPYVPIEMQTAPPAKDHNLFFADEEVSHLHRLERLFNECDETDFQIIESFMQNNTYAYIAEQCYISETTAKYRIGKMKDICGVSSRAELREYLCRLL